jgi:hypothetical protein
MAATDKTRINESSQASSQERCPLCDRDRYCYLIKNNEGEAYKVLCQWTDALNPPEGWNHVSIAKDGRPVFVKIGSQQKKRKSKKYPAIVSLYPQDKPDIPQWQDIHIPVKEVGKGHTVRLKPGNPGGAETLYVVHRIDGKQVQGKHTLVAKLKIKDSFGVGTMEVPLSEIEEIVTYDPKTGAKEQFIEYHYSETQKVVRTQWTDRRQVYSGKSKQMRPYWWSDTGGWHCGKGEQPWTLYRQNEAEQTIQSRGIVFAIAGEQAVESLRGIGLTATCNQGGEGGFQQIAGTLHEAFQWANTLAEVDEEIDQDLAKEGLLPPDNPGLKPLLVIWADNDEIGRSRAESLLKACYQNKVTAVAIDPLLLWPDMPEKGDAKEWVDHCKASGILNEQMYRMLENVIDQAIDQQEEEAQYRWQRDAWKAPTSYRSEIGEWITVGKGEDAKRIWQPLCNFDFVVEREVKDDFGGALVLQVKRSFENHQARIILNSTDYTKPDTFTDAVKKALGVGIVCNLTKTQLGALINVKLHEYRTTRRGKLFKRIDRYGQQADGTWVFRDRQYTKDGSPTNENESGWVFNPSLGKDDFIPCPELAPEDPEALKRLVDASRQFFGPKNIHQVLFTMGWTAGGLHSQEIFNHDSSFPLDNLHGVVGSFKTLTAETALSLVGTNWPQMGMLARVSTSALYEHGSRTGSLPFFWDDPDRNPENEELAKSWYNRKPRKVRGNEQTPHSPMGITSNHVFGGDQAATYTRFVRTSFERASSGSKESFQVLKAAQAKASGAFPQLLKLGYAPDVIATLEQELLSYLPLAHARIAQSLAIVTWYAQKIVNLTGGTEDIKQWVIENCCAAENDSDNAGDSLRDFCEKISALESGSEIGEWNFVHGKEFVAIHYSSVWALVDARFKPATYNQKSLKNLILKAGGNIRFTTKFAQSRDQQLAYERALLTSPDGLEKPKRVPKAAWLIPVHYFEPDGKGNQSGNQVIKGNQNLITTLNLDSTSVSGACSQVGNQVIKKNEFNIDLIDSQSSEVPSPTEKAEVQNSDYSDYLITEDAETELNQGVEPVINNQQNLITEVITSLVTSQLEVITSTEIAPSPSTIPIEADELLPQLLQQGDEAIAHPPSTDSSNIASPNSSPLLQKTGIEVLGGVAVTEAAVCSVATSKAVPSPQPRQLPPVGTRIEPLNGTYSGLVCIVQSLKGNMIQASPENNQKKPAYGYLAGEYKILPATFAPTAVIEESPEVKEYPAAAETLQTTTPKPADEVIAVNDNEWQVGDRVLIDGSDLPAGLKRFDGCSGVVVQVAIASCLIRFDDDGEVMHILHRGLRRA